MAPNALCQLKKVFLGTDFRLLSFKQFKKEKRKLIVYMVWEKHSYKGLTRTFFTKQEVASHSTAFIN